jgi:hypothetical protein
MNDSSWHEELSADWIRQMPGYSITDQQREVTVDGLTGHIDGVLHTPGIPYLWEHKAVNHFTWGMFARGGDEPIGYFTQCAFYMKGLGLEDAILLIKNKNTAQYLDYCLFYDVESDVLDVYNKEVSGESDLQWITLTYPNILRDAMSKFAMVDQHVANGSLPARPFPLGTNFPCGYCTWEDACWSEYEQTLQCLGEMGEIPIEHMEHYRYHLEAAMHAKRAQDEYEAIRPRSVELLIATGCKVATCGDPVNGYRVSLRTSQREGKITNAWVNVTFRDKAKRKKVKEEE